MLTNHRYARNKCEKDTREEGSHKLFWCHQGSKLPRSGFSYVRFSPPSHSAPPHTCHLSDSQGQSHHLPMLSRTRDASPGLFLMTHVYNTDLEASVSGKNPSFPNGI